MSAPSRPFVTIDDPVTIIEPHRVLLEWVEIVERQGFRVRSRRGSRTDEVYNHDQEGTTWARGHHLPDSEVVVALRAAASLAPPEGEQGTVGVPGPRGPKGRRGNGGPLPVLPALPPAIDLYGSDIIGDIDEPIKSFKEAMEDARKQAHAGQKISIWRWLWGRE